MENTQRDLACKLANIKEKNMYIKNAKETKGITLVALVITIIIIIILATVTINMAFGDNGLLKQAQLAKDLTANSTTEEQEGMNRVMEEYANLMAEDDEIPVDPGPIGLPTDGSFSAEKGVNTPLLASNMKLVIFNSDNNTWVKDETNSGYSYVDTSEAGNTNKSEWANAEVTVDGITSYFVWIPRYAYKIIGENNIDIKFIKGTGKETVDGTPCKYVSENPTADDYIVHPAFTDEEENGGWDSQLPGIWIGKYEASLANKTDGSNIVPSNSNANILLSEHTDKTVVTKSGYSSWRYCTIGNMYTNAKAYGTNLGSHMLKNSEWGAVAYLTESIYGKNGTEIGFNNNNYITGGGTGNEYATKNTDQSTTGNVYGIYDLRGGSNEYVAAYYKEGDTSYLNNGISFTADGNSDEYSTAYDGLALATSYKYGDATYETSGWHSDSNNFFGTSDYPFLRRGGQYSLFEPSAGIFNFYHDRGEAYLNNSFRLALAFVI